MLFVPYPAERRTLTDDNLDVPECPHCLGRRGLCRSCQRQFLPQLAVNGGWLKLIGEAVAEQTARQTEQANKAAIEKAKRRDARKRHRSGLRGLLMHVATAA